MKNSFAFPPVYHFEGMYLSMLEQEALQNQAEEVALQLQYEYYLSIEAERYNNANQYQSFGY